MKGRPGGVKTAGIVIVAALLAVFALSAVVWMGIRGGTRDTIVLPDAAAPAEPALEPAPSEADFLRIDRENVQQALASMARPEAYHQMLSVTSLWQGGSASATVELWRSGALARARVDEPERTRHILTDGETVWLWYEGDTAATAFRPEDGVTFDDLAGVPTYELLTRVARQDVLDAGFLTLDGERNVLYLAVQDGASEDRYWVDTATRLLYRADSFSGTEQTYQLRQLTCEVITAEDDTLQGVFQLPDGTALS